MTDHTRKPSLTSPVLTPPVVSNGTPSDPPDMTTALAGQADTPYRWMEREPQGIVSSQRTRIRRRTTCFGCGLTRLPDYTRTYDLSGIGTDIIDICDDCLDKAQDAVQYNTGDSEYMCDRCIEKTATFSLDGGCLRMCNDCQERDAIQEMHNHSHVTYTSGESEPIVDGIIVPNLDLAKAFAITLLICTPIAWAVGFFTGAL